MQRRHKMNQVILIGNLTKDPEGRYIPESQTAVCTFTLAISRGKGKDGNDKGADFPRVTVFGRQAENCERFLTKGRKVAVQGRIATNSYKNKEGATVYTTDVVADRVEFLEWGDKPEKSGMPSGFKPEDENQDSQIPSGFQALEDDDDIPF
jgi:single-strand DNA-binding protein